jgi:hypothetical protein
MMFRGESSMLLQSGLYGPFKTHAEVRENECLTLLGPHAQVSEGGEWDPAWDKPQ